ncbi:MAG: ABC transporter permease [Phycisphaeraceae bacterium]
MSTAVMTTTQPLNRRRWLPASTKIWGLTLITMVALCLLSLPYTIANYNGQDLDQTLHAPSLASPWLWMGTDQLGRSLLVRVLLGGAVSLGIGLFAAAISVVIGTAWGMVAGYSGGKIDQTMMRIVDVLYGLPYILLVVLLSVAFAPFMERVAGAQLGNLITLLIAIGAVSWLTLARVVRGQVLSLKSQPYVEAAHASGCSPRRIVLTHILPNLIGPIIVYTTLTVPQAILQESFLSFLGIGVSPPMPSWGNLAAEGLGELNPIASRIWLLAWPCGMLAVTLLALNFVGEGLRDRFDPHAHRKR